MDTKPALLVDVDGVLNPYTLNQNAYAKGAKSYDIGVVTFKPYYLLRYRVWLSKTHGDWLNNLSNLYELFWFTSWEYEANNLIAPILGIPELPVIEMPPFKNPWHTWKMPAILEWANNGRKFAWIDDDIGPDAMNWGGSQESMLFYRINPDTGLTLSDVEALEDFAAIKGK